MTDTLEEGMYVLNAQRIQIIKVGGKFFLSHDGFRPSSLIESAAKTDTGWKIEYYLGSKRFNGELTKLEAA